MATHPPDSVCYCGDAPNPDESADVVHCWGCGEFFHARCTGVAKEREMPLAWGEYLIWKFICRKCAQKHQHPTEHIARREGGLLNIVIGRVMVLNALKCSNLLVSFEAAATPLIATSELTKHLPASSHTTALGVAVCWEHIARSLQNDDKLITSADGSKVGIRSLSSVFPELTWKRRMRKSSSNKIIASSHAAPDRPAPFLFRLDSDVEVVNRNDSLVEVTEFPFDDNIAEYKHPTTSAQRTTSLHFDVISGIHHKVDGWKVTPGSFIEIRTSGQPAVARVVDVLLLPGSDVANGSHRPTTYFAYVQWMASPNDVADNWQTSIEKQPEHHSCPGPSNSKLIWLNKTTAGDYQRAYCGHDPNSLPSYPSTGPFVSSWLTNMSERVDRVGEVFPTERYLTLDTDYVNLCRVRFAPVAVHFVPMREHTTGCVTCCNLINQPLSTTSRWYSRQVVSFVATYAVKSAAITSAAVITVFAKKSRQEETKVTGRTHCLRPDYYFTYGYNPHTRGFFALPPALRLTIELEGEYNNENLGQRMTELLRTCEPDKLQVERKVMDGKLEVEVTDEEIVAPEEWGNRRFSKNRWLKGSCGFSDAKRERLNIKQLDMLPLATSATIDDRENDDLWERDSAVADVDVFQSPLDATASRHLNEAILENRREEIMKTDTLRQGAIKLSEGRYGNLQITTDDNTRR